MNDLKAVRRIPDAPPRPADAHKGDFGTVVVVGGCATMIGAPALCASAAFRAGAGLVKVVTPPEVLPFVLTLEPSATGVPLADSAAATLAGIDAADPARRAVLAVGPGLGRASIARDLLLALLARPGAMVLDADGLNLLAQAGPPCADLRPPASPLILTPHPGEFARLARPARIDLSATDPRERPLAAAALARAHHAVVLLKGQHTVVSDGQRVFTNATGNPALATAGSGDVLTGLLAALIAQGLEPFDAACLAAHLHGLAADLWTARHGPSGLTARDLAALLPDAFARHRKSRAQPPRKSGPTLRPKPRQTPRRPA